MANGTIDFEEEAASSPEIDFQEEAAPRKPIAPPSPAQTAALMSGGATGLGAFVPPGMGPIREFGRAISKPLVDLTPTPGQIVESARQFGPIGVDYRKIAPPMTEEQVAKRMKESPAAAAVIGAGQALGDLESFFTSPLGIATLATGGLGAIPAGVQRGVALAFSAQMASQTPELARELGEELGKPEKDRDYSKISRLTVNAIANTGFTAAGGVHGLAPRRPIEAPPLPGVERAAAMGGTPIVEPGRRMVVPPPGMATLEQAEAFREAGRPVRRPIEEVRVPPEAPEGQPTFPPSGLGRPEPPAFTPALEVPPAAPGQIPLGTIQPPPPPIAPPYVSGRAAQAVREMGQAQQRAADFGNAVAEKVFQDQTEPIHPDKPLTENQLRIIKDSLVKTLIEQQLGGAERGTLVEPEAPRPEPPPPQAPRPPRRPPRGEERPPEAPPTEPPPTEPPSPPPPGGPPPPAAPPAAPPPAVEPQTVETQAASLKAEDFPPAPKKTSQFIRIQTADGKVIPAYFEGGYMDLPLSPYHGKPWVSYLNEQNQWTTGLLHEGDKVLDPIPPFKPAQAKPTAPPSKLVAAAYMPEGATVPETGPHHPAILKRLGIKGFETPESRNTPQFGFVDENGVFHTREESAEIAKATGQDLKEFEEGEPAHSDEIEAPNEPGTPISETKPPVPATKPPVPATPEELEKHLTVEEPDISQQREAGKFAQRQMDELKKQMDDLDKKIKALEPKVKATRGWNRGRIKPSARKSDVKEYQDLNNQLREVSNQRFAIERASRADREAVEYAGERRTVNDKTKPLLQRLGARINLDARAGLQPPEEVETAFVRMAQEEVKKRYPDASQKELEELGGEVQRAARLRMDLDNEFRMNPALNSLYRRRQKVLEQLAYGTMVPSHEFSAALKARISKYTPLQRESGDYGKPVEKLPHDELERLRADIAKETEQIQKNAAELEAKRQAEEADEKAKEAELMKQAQAVADSAVRTGKKGGRSAVAVKEDLVSRVKNALEELTKKSRVKLERDQEFKGEDPAQERYVASHGDDSIQAVAYLTPEAGKFKVEAYRTSDMKKRYAATFDNRADAEWFIKGLAAEGPGKSIIGVPGDGVYAITNSGQNLLDTWQRAKGIDTSAGRARTFNVSGKVEKPPGRPKTLADWRETKEYYGLEDSDKIAGFSPELKLLAENAEKKTGKPADKITTKDVDDYLKEQPPETKGVISGSAAEKWADNVIKQSGQRLRSGLDPELAAAGIVKGAAILERGITEFARWSAEMVREFGEAIRPHLRTLFQQAQALRMEAFKRQPPAPAGTPEAPRAPRAAQPPPSPVEPGPAEAAPGQPVHGIAARVSAAAAQQGIIAPIEPGEGIAAAESVEHGRDLLNKGANPQAVLDEFNRTKAVTADGMAVVRAQGERLRKAANDAANKYGITSLQYEAAWKADSDWTAAIKPMQTEWHKIGQAQQGEVEIDTGTFHGLRRAFFEATGRDFTPTQKEAAERIAAGVKKATDEADKAKDQAIKTVQAQAGQPASPGGGAPGARTTAGPAAAPGKTPATRARARRGQPAVSKPLPQRVWARARQIIDSGNTDFDDVRHKLAVEFGQPLEEITRMLAEPKAVRTVTDDMYRKMAERRRLVQQAKNWLKDQQAPGWYRFIRNVPRVFFIDKVFGHGTVGMITHAGLNIFNPTAWKTYWPNFARQYRLLVDPGYHERMMQDLVRDPLFTRARRAGLANDPFRYQDDYQTPGMEKWLGKLGLAGNRGFDSLKLFRQARFNQLWNDLPPNLQNARYAQLLADAVNHATGVVRTSFGGEWANWTFFAPKLEGSRWAWMIGDPVKAAKTFVDDTLFRTGVSSVEPTPEARAAAMAELKQKAYIAGTYLGLLALNQGILSASGSKEKVNFTNPRRSDFMAFKAEGHSLGIVSPMLGMVRLFANMVHAAGGKRGKVESLQSRADEMGATVEQYTRGKLSPFMGFGVDLASQADFQGRPLPFSSDTVPKYLRDQGIGKYTYGEYAAQEFTPIPISEAVREVWRAQGMKEDEITRYLDALLVGVIAGGTGARISVTTPTRK